MSITLNIKDSKGVQGNTHFLGGQGLSIFGGVNIGGVAGFGKPVTVVVEGDVEFRTDVTCNLWGDYSAFLKLPPLDGTAKITVYYQSPFGNGDKSINISWGNAKTPAQADPEKGILDKIGDALSGVTDIVTYVLYGAVILAVGYGLYWLYKRYGK